MQYLPEMASYKSHIQTAVLNLLTQRELEDVRDCVYNDDVVGKLIEIARGDWNRKNGNTASLYCAAMAVGTIIKEYEWGTQYIMPDGLFALAKRICGVDK